MASRIVCAAAAAARSGAVAACAHPRPHTHTPTHTPAHTFARMVVFAVPPRPPTCLSASGISVRWSSSSASTNSPPGRAGANQANNRQPAANRAGTPARTHTHTHTQARTGTSTPAPPMPSAAGGVGGVRSPVAPQVKAQASVTSTLASLFTKDANSAAASSARTRTHTHTPAHTHTQIPASAMGGSGALPASAARGVLAGAPARPAPGGMPGARPSAPATSAPRPPSSLGAQAPPAGTRVSPAASGAAGSVGSAAGAPGTSSATPAPAAAATSAPGTMTAVDAFRKMREEFAKLRAMKERRQAEQAQRASSTPATLRAGAAQHAAAAGSAGTPPTRAGGRMEFANPAAAARHRATTAAAKAGMFGARRPRSAPTMQRRKAVQTVRTIEISEGMLVRDLAQQMGVKVGRVLSKVEELGEALKADSVIDPDIAEIVAQDSGHKVKRLADPRRDRVRTEPPTAEQLAERGCQHRAPIVTVMGHVDHGKTTLLDALRGTNVADREAGGITQAVAAFSVALRAPATGVASRGASTTEAAPAKSSKGEKRSPPPAATVVAAAPSEPKPASAVDVMTFLDTPGHALFSSMRKRGNALTDVVVLVVDGRDGVMPQTKECVQIILEAASPVVVAVTKADTVEPTSAVQRVAKQLLELGLATEGMGGDAPILAVSARTGFGLQELKDAIALQAEMLDIRADISAPGEAVVVDARSVKGMGIVADCVVRWGTLRVGDIVVAGLEYGRIKALLTDAPSAAAVNAKLLTGTKGPESPGNGKAPKGNGPKPAAASGGAPGELGLASVDDAPAGVPVRVMGLKGIPPAGADLLVVENEERAKAVTDGRRRREEARALLATAEADAVRRAAERAEYSQRRQRKAAYDAAVQRERRRHRLRMAGAPIPPELAVQPWEVAILRDGADGKIAGVGSTGRNLRTQGDQQQDVTQEGAGTNPDGTDRAAPPKALPFVLRSDSAAALVAVQDALARVPQFTTEVLAKVVNSSVGELSEKDVQLASDMGAQILAFNVKVAPAVAKAAERRKTKIIQSKVIYHLLDEVCDSLSDLMTPSTETETVAVAEVKQVFEMNTKKSTPQRVAGCVITEGNFPKAGMAKYVVMRNSETVAEVPSLASLMHIKEKIEVAKKGQECGMQLEGFSDVAPGDRILAIRTKTVKPKLVMRFD